MEAVAGKVVAARISVGVFDDQQLISDSKEVLFDSTSQSQEERTKTVELTVKGDTFAKKEYRLVLKNLDTLQVQDYPVTINITFSKIDF